MSSSSSAQKCYYSYVATRCLSSSTLADGKPKTSLETGDLVLTDSPLFSKDIIKGRKESTGETGSFPSDGLKRCIQARLLRDFNRLPGGTKVLITELSIKPPGCSFYCAGSTYSLPIDKFDFGEADDLAIAMHNYSAFGVEIKAGQIVWTLRRPTQHRRKWLAYLNGKADYFPEEYALSLNEAMNQLVKFAKEGDFDSVRKLANPTLMKMHGLQGRTVLLMLADADTYARRTAKCADYMIHLGCNPSATDSKGDTAAHLAAGNNNLQLLALLAFESKWLQNYQGLTPLMVAVEAGKWRCIKHLLHLFRQNKYHQFKTKYLNEMKSCQGLSALDIAKRAKIEEMIEFELGLRPSAGCDWHIPDHLAQLQAVAPCEHQRTICKCDVPDEKGRTKLWRISSGTGVCSGIMNEAIRADPTCADATGNTCLHAAVNSGNLEAVRELIALDVNVNAPAEDGSTPLMRLASSDCCSDSQSVQVAKKLLENDANWNLRDRNGCTALQLARKSNKHSLVKLLEEYEGKDYFDTVQLPHKSEGPAAAENSERLVFTPHSEKKSTTEFVFPAPSRQIRSSPATRPGSADEHISEAESYLPVRNPVLESYNSLGQTQVAVASSNGDNTTLSKLRQSVDKEDLKRAVNTPDNSLKTPVMLAALNNYPTTIKLLHEMGATDLSQGDRAKLTALAHAAMRGNKDCIAVLLSLGAEPHTEDFSGNTPLIWAARENHFDVIGKLSEVLQNLSNWTHRGEYNMSALEWATYLQHHKIANLIVLSINSLQTDARAQEAAQEMPSIEASEAISAQLPLPALLPNDRYRMLSRPSSRGVAIMINNVDFDNTDRRNGAMADTHETGLYQAFVKLGLRVETHHNLSSHFFNSHNLISLNRHETEYEQHDVFVLCVMSHGEDGHIIGSDGGRIELEPLFNQVRQCDSLAGKPKIFIVQACRLLSTSHPAESANVIRGQDCLYIYSACRGQLSGRDPNTGCIFIQALKDEILAADLRSVEFTHLLPKVVKRVLELTNGAQVVSSETTLSKLLCLPPTRDLLTNL